ncbi:hypothetical protein AWB69_09194 [Caballeronia udeis]|uniref:Uncharacterized protein n=1 Tax=Caballeronia udeis TaxID=1232866 RepID=A0A158K058_9BURK|nr:hypothetical protein AWB69_09194 [Caballeronia udeis]
MIEALRNAAVKPDPVQRWMYKDVVGMAELSRDLSASLQAIPTEEGGAACRPLPTFESLGSLVG